jgi:hypothetical protein
VIEEGSTGGGEGVGRGGVGQEGGRRGCKTGGG